MPGDAPRSAPGPSLSPGRAAALLLERLDQGGSGVLLARSVEGQEGTGPAPRLLVLRDPADPARLEIHGTLGDPGLDAAGVRLAGEVLEGDGRRTESLHHLDPGQGAAVPVYLELHHPPATLVIVGAGHIARPLAEMGTLLGLRVLVLDDRPAFATRERFPSAAEVRVVDFQDPFAGIPMLPSTHVVLVTRGHRYDYECLLRILQGPSMPGYLGLIGSRRRIRATFARLEPEGIHRERLAAIRAPVGLDLGAQTPAEIAVAVAAELVLLHRGGTGQPLRERERILERFFPAAGEHPLAAGLPPGGQL